MKKILFIGFCLLNLTLSAQKFYKDKTASLNAVVQAGYKYAQDRENSNVYWYMKYDQYGECLVQMTFSGNILKKAVIGHKTSISNLDRFKDLFKAVSRDETLSFDWTSSGDGYGFASNTIYYSGRAKYECDSGMYFLIIYPQD